MEREQHGAFRRYRTISTVDMIFAHFTETKIKTVGEYWRGRKLGMKSVSGTKYNPNHIDSVITFASPPPKLLLFSNQVDFLYEHDAVILNIPIIL